MKSKILAQAMTMALCMAFAVGCASTGGSTEAAKPVDEKAAIAKVLQDWGASLATKNVDSIMTHYSDAFSDGDGRGKAELKSFIQDAIANGYLDGAKVDVATAQITVNGDEAVAVPVGLSGDMGSMAFSISLKKEASGWRIVSSNQA